MGPRWRGGKAALLVALVATPLALQVVRSSDGAGRADAPTVHDVPAGAGGGDGATNAWAAGDAAIARYLDARGRTCGDAMPSVSPGT